MSATYMKHFTPESLIRAMAPIETVIDQYIYQYSNDCRDDPAEQDVEGEDGTVLTWTTVTSQEHFANILSSIIDDDRNMSSFSPSDRYLNKLLLRFVSRLEREGSMVEDETLSELLLSQLKSSSSSSRGVDLGFPNPMDSCHVSFLLNPSSSTTSSTAHQQSSQSNDKDANQSLTTTKNSIVGIRVYPFHNDVGIRKVWEAGCCLAEFFLSYPSYVKDKHVLELGAGVGLTGLVVSACCGAKSVHMTDYTEGTLDNLKYNIDINESFLRHHSVQLDSVTSGYLEWGEYCTNKTESSKTSDHNVLIAADVVYDKNEIPCLIATVKTFLIQDSDNDLHNNNNQKKVAIFATTYRNEKTFDEFMSEISQHGIETEHIDSSKIQNLDYVFPCYTDQPRSDVRICLLNLESVA